MCNFPQKLWFSQKLHLPLDNWPMCHQSWPSLAFPSSPAIPCWCLGCVSLSEQFSLLSTVSGAPCALCPSFIVSSRFLHVIGDNLWGHAELHLFALGTDTPCVIAVSCICQAGWVSAWWARQIFIKSQDLPEDVGDLSKYHFSSNLGGFSGAMGSSVYCSTGSPFSSKCFISYLCHAKEDLLVLLGSGPAAWVLMRSGAHHWTSDFCSLHHGSDFRCLPSSLLFSWEAAHRRPQFRGAMWHAPDRWVQPLLPLPQTDTWLQWNQCQPSHHCQ